MKKKTVSSPALLVDLYELTMAAGYFERGLNSRSTFELFVRHLPSERAYLIAAGIESALDYLENLRFEDSDVQFLRAQPALKTVSDDFFDYLRKFRFTGDVQAVPEGSPIFAEEPILQVTAPIPEAQIIETYLLSVVNFETLVASKASRVVRAAEGRSILEFGTRRAHGPEAGVRAARAAYLAGCDATSNVLAGERFGIPLAGTAAHSWTQAFPTEAEAFEALLDTFPETAVLLIDTYDAIEGAKLATRLGRKIPGVRLDSGDLLEKSFEVREILDVAGFSDTKIVASGDLNEFKIARFVAAGAPIDVFGVGTEVATSRDVPALSVVYKLVEIQRGGLREVKTKFSDQKVYSPGRKQVWRFSEGERFHHDLIACADENYPEAQPLLAPVLRDGRRVIPREPIARARAATLARIARLPEGLHALRNAPTYPVLKSAALERLLDEVRELYSASRETTGVGSAQ